MNFSDEFPPGAAEWPDDVNRRDFLKWIAASLAATGGSGCVKQPLEKIVPYGRQPEEIVPGRPLHYATATTLGGFARGVLVETHEGRPTKAEGNPLHPASLGATDIFMQASVLDLYDPDRSHSVTHRGQTSTWEALRSALAATSRSAEKSHGAGVHLLTERLTSPTLLAQLQELMGKFPELRWHSWEPLETGAAHAGAKLAFGEAVDPIYDFGKAEVVVALDADFLGGGPACLRHLRAFADQRRISAGRKTMSRLWVAEAMPTITGAMADHRLALRTGDIENLTQKLWAKIDLHGRKSAPGDDGTVSWIEAAARDLSAHPGTSLVLAGNSQPPAVHALAHALNHRLGNVGKTVRYIAPVGLPARGIDPGFRHAAIGRAIKRPICFSLAWRRRSS